MKKGLDRAFLVRTKELDEELELPNVNLLPLH